MSRRPPRYTLPDTRVPYTSLFRSQEPGFIVLCRLAAMGVAVILMIAFLFMVLEPVLERWWLWGLLVCAGGMLIQRTAVQRYAAQLGLTLVATGLIMTGIGVYVLEAVSPFILADRKSVE